MVEVLSGTEFFTRMIKLVKPLIDNQINLTRYAAFGENLMHD
jgi:hypothetical protein